MSNKLFVEEFLLSKLRNKSYILCSEVFKEYLEIKNIKVDYKNENQEENKYDIIIIDEDIRDDNISKNKKYLKDDGKLIFIVDVITSLFWYKYHPYNCLSNISFGYISCYDYLENIYDRLRSNNLKIIDSYRLNTKNIVGLNVDRFIITCYVRN